MDNLKRRHIPGQQDNLAELTEDSYEAYDSTYGNEKKMHRPIPTQPPVVYSSNKVYSNLVFVHEVDSFSPLYPKLGGYFDLKHVIFIVCCHVSEE